MSEELWKQIDQYITDHLIGQDQVLEQALKSSSDAGLPNIQVAPNQGQMLMMLAKGIGASKILEVGTLGGYSTIWLARALPKDGKLITLELDPKHADVALKNFARAGFDKMIELRLGPALESMQKLVSENAGPFQLIFIDADKANIPEYFELAMKLAQKGSYIIVDNVIRDGEILDRHNTEPATVGVRKLYELLRDEDRVTATAIQTVGVKGHDGLLLALVH